MLEERGHLFNFYFVLAEHVKLHPLVGEVHCHQLVKFFTRQPQVGFGVFSRSFLSSLSIDPILGVSLCAASAVTAALLVDVILLFFCEVLGY